MLPSLAECRFFPPLGRGSLDQDTAGDGNVGLLFRALGCDGAAEEGEDVGVGVRVVEGDNALRRPTGKHVVYARRDRAIERQDDWPSLDFEASLGINARARDLE